MVLSFEHDVPLLFGTGGCYWPSGMHLSHSQARKEKEEASTPGTVTTAPRYEHHAGKEMDTLTVELPGAEKEHVTLDVKGHLLYLSAERKMPGAHSMTAPEETSGGNGDRGAGRDGTSPDQIENPATTMKYVATFSLGKKADVSAIQGEYKNGLLTIKVPHTRPETHRIALL